MQFNGVEYSPAYTKKGDTLETLAAAFSVSPKDIVEANNVYWTRPLASAKKPRFRSGGSSTAV